MNFYNREVMIIPANKTISAIVNRKCGVYECPLAKKGQYNARANEQPLYIAFKADGEVKALYRIKEVLELDIDDSSAVNSSGYKNQIDNYKKIIPGVRGRKWIFIIDFKSSIDLYYPVLIPSGARGNEYRSLKEIFNSPAVEDNGRIVLKLPLKNGNSTKKSRSVKNNTLNTSQV